MRLSKAQLNTIRKQFDSLVYTAELDCVIRKVRKILAEVGCKVEKDGAYVTLRSPITGSHTLNMSLGVRPVTDLLVHARGFAEQQPQAKPISQHWLNEEIEKHNHEVRAAQVASDLAAWGQATGRGTLVSLEIKPQA